MSKLQEPVPSSHSASKAAAADVLETDDPRDFQTDPHDGLTFLLVFTTYEVTLSGILYFVMDFEVTWSNIWVFNVHNLKIMYSLPNQNSPPQPLI